MNTPANIVNEYGPFADVDAVHALDAGKGSVLPEDFGW